MPAGRPLKNGVDYFPLDVILDDKFELIEAEHGIQGFGVLIKIYQKIYANNYWIKFDKKAILVFSNRINVGINLINAIINSCIEWEIFNAKLFKSFEVLTSAGIQKRFFEIVKRRKVVEVCRDFLLIDLEINVYNNLINVDHNSQRKGKERKVKGKIKDLPQKKDFAELEEPEFYLTKKERKLSGKRLDTFELFWNAFNYKKDRANAADSWLDIPQLTDTLVEKIIESAKTESLNRQDLRDSGTTPKMAQGWLSSKRWEDEQTNNQETDAEYAKRMGLN